MGMFMGTCTGMLVEAFVAMAVEGYPGTHQCGDRDAGITMNHEHHTAARRQGSRLGKTKLHRSLFHLDLLCFETKL